MKIQLYRYFGSHAFESLRDKMLMLSRPSTLNDPFEFLNKSIGQITMSKARHYFKSRIKSDAFYEELRIKLPHIKNKKEFKKMMRDKLEELAKKYFEQFDVITDFRPEFCKNLAEQHFRLSCFSSPNVLPQEEILMWSHYAAKHTGVRIKFLLDDSIKFPYFLKKVLYRKERAGIDVTNTAETDEVEDALVQAIITKAEGWSYEREYRMFTLPSMCSDVTGPDGVVRSFMPFTSDFVLQIDFGINCAQAEIDRISSLARTEYPHVELRKATYHKSEYAIDYENL